MKGQTYVFLTIIFIIIITVFALLNTSLVEVNYLFWSGESPLVLVILFSVLLGCIVTAVASSLKLIRLQRNLKEMTKLKETYEKHLKEHHLLEDKKEPTDDL